MSEKDSTETVRNMRRRTSRMEREGDYWEESEKEQLRQLFNDNVGITAIAVLLQRTEPAVIQQIEKQDLYQRKENPLRRRKIAKEPGCLCGRCQMDRSSCPCYELYLAKQEET